MHTIGFFHFLLDLVPILLRLNHRFDSIKVSPSFASENRNALRFLELLGFERVEVSGQKRGCEHTIRTLVQDSPAAFTTEYVRSNVLVVSALREAARSAIRLVSVESLEAALESANATPEAAQKFRDGAGVLYLLRGKSANGRWVENESEVVQFVTRQGGCAVELAHLSPDEQIALVARTKVLVGVTGAGFANMAFLPSGATVLCLVPTNFITSCFVTLGRVLGIDFATALVKSVGDLKSGRPGTVRIDDETLRKIELVMQNPAGGHQ